MKHIIQAVTARLEQAQHTESEVEAIVLDFFRNHPNPDDPDVHELAGQLGMEPELLEKVIYQVFTRFIQNCGS